MSDREIPELPLADAAERDEHGAGGVHWIGSTLALVIAPSERPFR